MYILYIILVGLVAGWATGKIMKGSGYGVLTDILLGIAGAIIGSRLLGLLGIYSSGGIVLVIAIGSLGGFVDQLSLACSKTRPAITQTARRRLLSCLSSPLPSCSHSDVAWHRIVQ